jgi:hypothetical protein
MLEGRNNEQMEPETDNQTLGKGFPDATHIDDVERNNLDEIHTSANKATNHA